MIVLFNDSPEWNRTVGVYRIATVLRRHGLEVEVVDWISKWNLDQLLEYIDGIPNIQWFGISGRFLPPNATTERYVVVRSGQQLYEKPMGIFTYMGPEHEDRFYNHLKSKGVPVVFGGPNAEALSFVTDKFDYISIGYSDAGVLAIHDHIVSGQELIFEGNNNQKIVKCNRDYPVTDLGNLDNEYHESDCIVEGEVFPIEIGRGCIFSCAFCEYVNIGKKPGTYIRPKQDIEKDLHDRWTKYKSNNFIFLDDTFNDTTDKLRMIKEIKQNLNFDFNFWAYCRIDLLKAHPEQVDLISEIGWKYFTFGIETFNRESGRKVGKGADPNKIKDFLVYLRTRFPEIKMQVNLIIGLPDDTREKVFETLDWFIENKDLDFIVRFMTLGIRVPNPESGFGSKIGKDPEKFGYNVISRGDKPHTPILWATNNMTIHEAWQIQKEAQTKYAQLSDANKKGSRLWSMYFEEAAVWDKLSTLKLHDIYIQNKVLYQKRKFDNNSRA